MKRRSKRIPKDGVVFKIALNGDAVCPIETMVQIRRNEPKEWKRRWKFVGKRITGKYNTRRFMLISGEKGDDFDRVKELHKNRKIPEGQWLEAFRTTYERNNGDPIGVADPSWMSPRDYLCFPCINSYAILELKWMYGRTLSDQKHRWLVEVK